jgi:hypothetical protein
LNSYDVDATFFKAGFTLLGVPVFADLPAGTGLVYDFDNGTPQRDALRAIGAANTGWGVDEVMSAAGDSGGPGFLWDSGDLEFKVAGITSFGETVPADLNYNPSTLGIDQTFGEAAIDTRVSAFASYVEDVTSGEIPTLKARLLNNGGNWVANAGTLRHHALRVADSISGATTALDIQTGGIIGTGSYLPAIPAVELSGTSQLTISGGAVDGSFLGVLATEFSSVEMLDGAVANFNAGRGAMSLAGFSTAEIHGGIISGDAGGVLLHDQSSLAVTGGEIFGVNAPGIGIGPGVEATVTITGGEISGSPEDLVNNSPMSRIRIVGRAESFNRPLGEISDESGSLTGLFADGTPFDLSFFRGGSGVIELVAAAGALPGDFNHDGQVDAGDYVVWRKTGGTQPAYDQWRANFGRAAGVGAQNTAVPEPRAFGLYLLSLVGFVSCGTRRRDLQLVLPVAAFAIAPLQR